MPVSSADLRTNPAVANGFRADADVDCRFKLRPVGGTTPKFYCELPNGEEMKVKYGQNPELHAEVAASRLLNALGFGADRMFVVKSVRCAGCPAFPFQSLRCHERTGLESACFPGGTDYTRMQVFDPVVIERKLEGRVVEATEDQGWAWYELGRIDPAQGGSSRTEVDALRLMAVFLAHWDNKSPNQRLICPPDRERPDGTCVQALAIMQDLGATFGPTKIDLHNWRQGHIWKDRRTLHGIDGAPAVGRRDFPGAADLGERTADAARAARAAVGAAAARPVRRLADNLARPVQRRSPAPRRVGAGLRRQGPADQGRGAVSFVTTPASIVSPAREITWKWSSSPAASISMKL